MIYHHSLHHEFFPQLLLGVAFYLLIFSDLCSRFELHYVAVRCWVGLGYRKWTHGHVWCMHTPPVSLHTIQNVVAVSTTQYSRTKSSFPNNSSQWYRSRISAFPSPNHYFNLFHFPNLKTGINLFEFFISQPFPNFKAAGISAYFPFLNHYFSKFSQP